MSKRMLIDATHEEETRVAIVDGNKLAEYDYESSSRKPIKGNIYLAKVTRVEPSLQAAFVNFGGNRHGFLPFSEIHPDYFRIPIADREALLAEQEALLAEQEAEMEEDRDSEGDETQEEQGSEAVDTDNEGDDSEDGDGEEDYIEEIGGAVASLEGIEVEGEENAGNHAHFDATLQRHQENNTEHSDPWIEGEETDENLISSDQEGASEGSVEGQPQEEGEGNRDSRNRHRRGGRRGGRDNNNRRSQFRNKRSEVVGEEEMSGEERFRFNLRRKYKIQEVIKRGQIMLVQANKEERGNKGAAVGSYLSLPGRYCVLMPNSPRAGGVSRKIANYKDRARMREIMKELEVPKGMSVIVRTAGVARTKVEIKRDLDYLMRLWDSIRELTLQSTAPALVYEEADLIKRSIRDLYTRDVEDIVVAGEAGFKNARNFMKMMVPSHIKKVQMYEENQLPLFTRYQIETQIQEIGMPTVRLRAGGYLVINPTEALVSIDVNSGKATKERHIEETALKTNLEAADEVARQLRLRDLGGLVVIDFIDMEDRRNNAKVERRLKEALSTDRARVQVGRISSFGLLELSRQRLSPSLTESQYEVCLHCKGIGVIRTPEAMSIVVLRAIEEEGIRARSAQITVHVSNAVALYILNNKRKSVVELESRYGFEVVLLVDEDMPGSEYRLEVSRALEGVEITDGDADQNGISAGASEQDDQKRRAGGSDRSRNNNRRGGRGRGREREDRDDRPPQRDVSPAISGDTFEADLEDEMDDEDIEEANASERSQNREPREGGRKDVAPREGVAGESAADGENRRKRNRNRRRGGRNRNRGGDRPPREGGPAVEGEGNKPDFMKPDADGNRAEQPQQQRRSEPRERPPQQARQDVHSNDDFAARTPKPPREEKQPSAPKPEAAAVRAPQPKKEPHASASYEVVSEPAKEKKRGWWNRLVE